MIRNGFIWRGGLRALLLMTALVAVKPVFAQQAAPDPISGQATVLRLQNEYLMLVYGVSGTPTVAAVAAPDTNLSGRWGIVTTNGDPTTAVDDNRQAFAWNFLSYQVDPQITTQAAKWYRVGNSGDGTYSIAATADQVTRIISSTWDTSGTIAVPVSGGTTNGTQQQAVGIQVEERMQLIRDLVRVEYKFTNTGGYPRRVRARLFMDPIEDASWIVGQKHVEFATDYASGQIPDEWFLYSPLSAPEMSLRGIYNRFGATAPNRFVISATGPLANSAWGYTVNPNLRIDGTPDPANEACQTYYDTFSLLPGQTRTIVSYAGLGVAESDPTPPYVLSVQAPRTVGYVQGDNPDTPAPESSYASPNTFTISGYFYNVTEYDISNASMFITLPKGLTLAPGETAVRQVGSVLRQQEGRASWKVQVDPGVSGKLNFSVTSSGVPVTSKTVMSSIEIPAQATQTYASGLYLMSVPFQFSNPDTAVALNLSTDRVRLARWDTQGKKYGFYPDAIVSTVQPGSGYWFKPDLNTTLALKDATPVARSLSANYVIAVKAGWNMIGCPYVYAVPWANTRVSDGQQVLSLDEAAHAGWLRPTIFSYNPIAKTYEFVTLQDAMLEPWQGYWLRSDRDVFLIVPPVTAPGASVLAPDQRSAKSGWQIRLAARTRNAADLCNFAGVSRAVSDGYDLQDIEEPPSPGEGYVSLRFLHSDWGHQSGRYAQDMRADEFAGEKSWDFEVETDQAGSDVTLTWPGLNAQLPRNLAATVEDLSTGRKIYLRTQGSYVFKADAGTSRKFRLAVAQRSSSMLTITGLEVAGVSGRASARSINFQLSGDAVADVRILSPTGRVVQQVAMHQTTTSGRNSLIWDGTDNRGVRLTSGLVLVEVTATSPEGNSVRAVKPYVLTR